MTKTSHLGAKRRPERIIQLTEEFISKLPIPAANGDRWYDTVTPRLAVQRYCTKPYNTTFLVMLSSPERKAIGLDTNSNSYTLKARTLGEAREEIGKINLKVDELVAKGLTMTEHPQDILKPRRAPPIPKVTSGDRYELLMGTLMDAYARAVSGKGRERHGGDVVSFEDQIMIRIQERVGTGFALGQAIKKVCESQRLTPDKARVELLDAIVYLAGAVIFADKQSSVGVKTPLELIDGA